MSGIIYFDFLDMLLGNELFYAQQPWHRTEMSGGNTKITIYVVYFSVVVVSAFFSFFGVFMY